MRKILATESDDQVIVSGNPSELTELPIQTEIDLSDLTSQRAELGAVIAEAEDINAGAQVLGEVAEIVSDENAVRSVAAEKAIARAIEGLVVAMGVTPDKANKQFSMEGLQADDAHRRFKVCMEGVLDTIKKAGRAIWKLLMKVAEWIKTLYQRITLTTERLQKRTVALLDLAKKANASYGGFEIKSVSLRNFFSYRGKDYDHLTIDKTLRDSFQQINDLYKSIEKSAAKGIDAVRTVLNNPGSVIGTSDHVEWGHEHKLRTAAVMQFYELMFSDLKNDHHFESKRYASSEHEMVSVNQFLPFGDYLIKYSLYERNRSVPANGHVIAKIGSEFLHEPQPKSENREPLKSLQSRDIENILADIRNNVIYRAEWMAGTLNKISEAVSAIAEQANRRFDEVASNKKFSWGSEALASYDIARQMCIGLSRYLHGPISGLPTYVLKCIHYALNYVEASIKANIQNTTLESN